MSSFTNTLGTPGCLPRNWHLALSLHSLVGLMAIFYLYIFLLLATYSLLLFHSCWHSRLLALALSRWHDPMAGKLVLAITWELSCWLWMGVGLSTNCWDFFIVNVWTPKVSIPRELEGNYIAFYYLDLKVS